MHVYVNIQELKSPKHPRAFLLKNSFWQIYTEITFYSYICTSKLPMWTGILRTECFSLLQINPQQLLWDSLSSLKSKQLSYAQVTLHFCTSAQAKRNKVKTWSTPVGLQLLLQHHYKGLVWRTKSQPLATKELISKMGKRSTWMLA